MGNKAMNRGIPVVLILLLSSAALGETPKPMRASISRLTDAGAVLNICFENPSYKKLSDTDAIKVHELLMRTERVVESIATHYNDDILLTTYEMAKVKMSDDPSLREYAKAKYQYCGPSLLTDMDAYLDENERVIREFLSKGRKR